MAPRSDDATALPVTDARWRDFVDRHPDALCFHRPAWAELLADSYGYRPFVLALADDRGALTAGLPVAEIRRRGRRRWVSLPFTDCCPPLLSGGVDPGAFGAALDRARRAGGAPSLEVRAALSAAGASPRVDAVLHRTELAPDADSVFRRFHTSQVQRNIRRAEREAVVVRRAEAERDLTEAFYALQLQTRRRLGMPMQPRRFFQALWKNLLEPGHGFLLLAYASSQPIAGAVFLSGSRTLTYKYGASDAAFWRLRPNHLLFWTAIRGACEQGYAWFDFGRSDLEDTGLRAFKSGWGAEEADLVHTTLPAPGPRTATSRALPGARAIIRRSPAWVSRLSGELLYRYAA